jgi:DNA-binding NarL/FixJ family response regulator
MATVKVFVHDKHAIYRRGLAASLVTMEDVEEIGEAGAVEGALTSSALSQADVVVVDSDLDGGWEFIRRVRERTGGQVIVYAATQDKHDVLAAVQAGAVRFLCNGTLSTDAFAAGIRAAAARVIVIARARLGAFCRTLPTLRGKSLSPATWPKTSPRSCMHARILMPLARL